MGDGQHLLGTGDGNIEKTPFLFQFPPRPDRHRRREQILLQARDIDIVEFQTLGCMDRHQLHLVILLIVLFIRICQQRDTLQKAVQCRVEILYHFARVIVEGGLLRIFGEILHCIQQLLHIVHTVLVGGVSLERGGNAGGKDDMFSHLIGILGRKHGSKALDLVGKICQSFLGRAINGNLKKDRIFNHIPHAGSMFICTCHHTLHCRVADTPQRVVDDPPQRLLVVMVDSQSAVGQHILDLLAGVERNTAVNTVRNMPFHQHFLQCTRLHIGTIKNSDIVIINMIVVFHLEDGVADDRRFVVFSTRLQHRNRRSLLVLRPHLLGYLLVVVLDDGVGRIDDILGGPVVLLQFDKLRLGIVALEVEDVVDVGAAESVDALGIVAHHTDIVV